MNRRLKLITISLSVVYVVIIGGLVHRELADFVYGYHQGVKAGQKMAETGSMSTMSADGTFYLSMKSENGARSFPTRLLNQLDRKPMKAEIETMVVEVSDVKNKLPKGTLAADIFSIFLSLFVLFVMALIPVQTFRILRSVTKDKIFDPSNIRKMRFIGYALLAYYAATFVANFLHFRIAANVVEVDGYKLLMDWGNTTVVLLGFVVLMFAEVLKVSVQLKEEQELTV